MTSKPRPVELRQMCETRVSLLEASAVRVLFMERWSMVSMDGYMFGYAPFPDLSVILTIHAANQVVSQFVRVHDD